jgi:hypothetical protein
VVRTAYTQLHHSPSLLVGTLVGMFVLYSLPPLAVVVGAAVGDWPAMASGAAGWILMAVLAVPTARLYDQPAVWGLVLPAAGGLYAAMTLDSARRHLAGAGGGWKGRHYPRPGEASE